MRPEILSGIFNEIADLLSKGDEAAAQRVLQEHFDEFPESLRTEIVGRLAIHAAQKALERSAA